MNPSDIFEAELTDVYHYRLSYGGQSPYFKALAEGRLLASKCGQCGFVWVPFRPTCSHCYADAAPLPLSGDGEILTNITLPEVPPHLAHLGAAVASALVRPDGADTCIKTFVVSKDVTFGKGTRVTARFLPIINTIADFYFETGSTAT